MGKEEKEQWDWLYGDMDLWDQYTKKEESNAHNTRRNTSKHISNNSKFCDVNNRIREFIDRRNHDSN